MKKLNTLYAVVGAVGVLAAHDVSAAYDGTLTFNGLGGGNANGGGVFNVLTTPSGGTPALGNFGTFCIEKNEFIAVDGASYRYKINTGAVAGGQGGQTTTDPNSGLTMDNISFGTAWLYSQYRAGAIGGTGTAKSELQVAIWYLENEITTLVYGGVNGTAFYNAAKLGTSKNDTTVFNDSLGAYGVVALNLFTDTDGNGTWSTGDVARQDQLGIVPETSTIVAGALLLLPFGASTIRILRKHRAA